MIKRFVPIVLAVTLAFNSTVVYAQEQDVGAVITPLKKDQPAPYTGTLLSPKAAANITVQLGSVPEKIKIETDRVKAECDVNCSFKLNELKINNDADVKVLKASIESKDKQIQVLNEQLSKTSSSPNYFLYAASFVGGVVVTVLSVFAVSSVRNLHCCSIFTLCTGVTWLNQRTIIKLNQRGIG